MELRPDEAPHAQSDARKPAAPWFHRLSRPILFLTVTLTLLGAYLAFSIPVRIFPASSSA